MEPTTKPSPGLPEPPLDEKHFWPFCEKVHSPHSGKSIGWHEKGLLAYWLVLVDLDIHIHTSFSFGLFMLFLAPKGCCDLNPCKLLSPVSAIS